MNCEKLQTKLDRTASFRKREISNLNFQIQNVEGDNKRVLLRAAVLILYAHFEGFSKEAIKLFIKHLNAQNIPVNSMKHNLRTLFYTERILLIKKSTRKKIYNELIEEVLSEVCFNVNPEAKEIVSTESNLKFEVLEDLLFMIGIQSESFIIASDNQQSSIHTKKEFIDKRILSVRNSIAHGENVPITFDEFIEIKEFVVAYINSLKNYIVEISEEQSYLLQEDLGHV